MSETLTNAPVANPTTIDQRPLSEIKKEKAAKAKAAKAEKNEKPKEKAPKKEKAAKAPTVGEGIEAAANKTPELIFIQATSLVLPKDDGDVLWDARLKAEVPEALIYSIFTDGFTSAIGVTQDGAEGDTYRVGLGKTRIRALALANEQRRKAKLPEIEEVPALLYSDEVSLAQAAVSENEGRRESTPMERASIIDRALLVLEATDTPNPEAIVCKRFGINLKRLHEYLSLRELPESAQKALNEGRITLPAALALLHKEASTDSIEATLNRMLTATESGGVINKTDVQAVVAPGSTIDRLNAKQIKSVAVELEAYIKSGYTKDGKDNIPLSKKESIVFEGALSALELVLDARKNGNFVKKLFRIAE